MRKIQDILIRERVVTLSGKTKDAVLDELCTVVAISPLVKSKEQLLNAIKAREAIMSTGIGMGIAIPHAKIESIADIIMAVGLSEDGIGFQALDGRKVHLVILIAASNTQGDEFLKVLGIIGKFFENKRHREKFLRARNDDDVFRLFQHMDDHHE